MDGNESVTFTLYDAAIGGSDLWNETQSIDLDHGYFSVQLALDPTDFDGSARWLETRVGTTVLGPRQAIASVPYALALSAPSSLPAGTTLNGGTISTGSHYTDSNVVDGPLSLHGSTTLNGAVISTGSHYTDANVVDGPLSLHGSTTLNGAVISTGSHYTDSNVVDGPLSLHGSTTLNGAVISTGSHYTDANVVDSPLSLHGSTTLNGAVISTGSHYSDANVVDGALSLHPGTTLNGAALAVETPQGALCNGNFCTYTFSASSPPANYPTCTNPGKNIKIGTLSGTSTGNVSTIRITASGSHRGIGGSSYWCHQDVLLTVGDALFSNALQSVGSPASRCGYAGLEGAGYAVSHPNFTGGDVYWHIPLNCGAGQKVDFTIQYNPTYFSLTAQP